MSDGFMLYLDDDGVARHYDDTYDITIHCESEEEQQKAIEQLKSLQWIPCSERLPEKNCRCLTTNTAWGAFEVDFNVWINGEWLYPNEKPVAWMPLPEPYREDDHETD